MDTHVIVRIFTFVIGIAIVFGQCPHLDPDLSPWNPISDPEQNLVIDNEKLLLISDELEAKSITVTNGGKLVIDDSGSAKRIRVSNILMEYEGELHIGSEDCRYLSHLDIVLFGRDDDSDIPNLAVFGKKVIAVAPNGTLEIHGPYKTAWTRLADHLYPSGDAEVMISLEEDVSTWDEGDRIVVASTDFDMHQAEEFTLLVCPECQNNQVKIQGPVLYHHYSGASYGVDMRAEVGLLTRNILIQGEMEDVCYGDLCEWFDVDTFGGQTQILTGFRSAHIQGAELYHMGQQELGHYPIHFHRTYDVDEVGGYDPPSYVRQLSIHHTLSRCVTLHAADGLLVEDVVGYDSIGHCIFLEDGPEQRNIIHHNLVMVVRPGSLLPHDRDEEMCEGILDGTWGDYVPNAQLECKLVSGFWITHPNNEITDNVVAGSDEVGFFYVFHRVPTGPSIGLLPPYHAERSPLGSFSNNVAHSCGRVGFNLDLGVKTTEASEEDPREFLSMQMTSRYMPHENRDPLQPRVTAFMDNFLSYKNNAIGIHGRGGDIVFRNCRLADNGNGIVFVSDSTWPYDAGSHQEATGCVMIGESDNRGTNSPNNPYYGLGSDGQPRTLPLPPAMAQRGLVFWEGPVFFNDFDVHGFIPTPQRNSSVISFMQRVADQQTPRNTITNIRIDEESLPIYMGQEGNMYGEYNSDGDLNQIFYDLDGSATGYSDSYAVRPDNWLVRTEDCIDVPEFNAAICTEEAYGVLHITASDKLHNLTITRDGYEQSPITLSGATLETDISEPVDTNTYQPVVMFDNQYKAQWSSQPPPDHVTILLSNFEIGDEVLFSFHYPSGTSLYLTSDEWLQMEDVIYNEEDLTAGDSISDVENDHNGSTYYWDDSQELLFVRLIQRNPRHPNDQWNICAPTGCQRIHIHAT